MRRMSFGLTTAQFLNGSKDVTRRLGWKQLREGDRLTAVDRCMGFKRGQTAAILGVIEIVSVQREPLNAITNDDVVREGFAGRDARWFVTMFSAAMKCWPDTVVTRIEFRRVQT